MNEIVVVQKDALQTLIIDSVNACLKYHLQREEGPGESLPEVMTRQQVADYFGVTLRTVDTLCKQGILKKHFLGGLPRFKRDEVRAAFEAWK